MNSFLTIKENSEGSFKDKGSKFISFAMPISSVDEAMAIVKQKRKEFFDARHICYAYMIGKEREIFRANDDGEPSGTAGKPILGQINSYELTNILVVVVRYFGGVLLGTSGLINAYKNAANNAIINAQIIEIDIEHKLKILFGYENLSFVMRVIKDYDLTIVEQSQTESCLFVVSCKQLFFEECLKRLSDNHLIMVSTIDQET